MKKLITAAALAAGLVAVGAGGADAANLNGALSITVGNVHHSAHTAFQVNNKVGLVVADANGAKATSDYCNNCKTVAIAVQIDLASGPVVDIHAINAAVASERVTNNADTCAAAYQFIIAPNQTTSFSPSGLAGIAAIKAAVSAEGASADSCDVIQATVAGQMDALAGVLSDPSSYGSGSSSLVARAAVAAPSVTVTRNADVKTV